MTTATHPSPRLITISLRISGDTIEYSDGCDAVDCNAINNAVYTVLYGKPITKIYGVLKV